MVHDDIHRYHIGIMHPMSIVGAIPSPGSLARPRQRGLRVQIRVVRALMVKEALGRYGHENLGFFWIVAEPLVFMTGIMVLWSFAHVSHDAAVSPVPFALTGYSFITMWRHITSRSMGSIKSGAAMAYHRQVRSIDIAIARAALETVAVFAAFIVAYVPLWCLGLCPTLNDPLALVGGFALTAWFSFGFGLVLASLSEFSEVLHHVVPAFMYMTMPLTGIFYIVDWLPEKLQRAMLWSPLVNGVEMFRSGLFPPQVVMHYSVTYLVCCAALTTSLGLFLFQVAERRVET